MNQSIFERIVKLLRKAERATGPEAEVALAFAQKLATEHQVDLATIDTEEGEKERKEEFVKSEVEYSEKSLVVYIQWLLTNHFRVRTCFNSRAVKFVGRKSDVVFAQYLFGWLMDRFMAEWREERERPANGSGRRSSKSFFYGMYLGLDEKLAQAKKEAEGQRIIAVAFTQQPRDGSVSPDEMFERVEGKYQLALVNEKDELEKEYYRLNPNVSRRRGGSGVGHGLGIAAGRAAGARTRIPGIPLNNSTGSALA